MFERDLENMSTPNISSTISLCLASLTFCHATHRNKYFSTSRKTLQLNNPSSQPFHYLIASDKLN